MPHENEIQGKRILLSLFYFRFPKADMENNPLTYSSVYCSIKCILVITNTYTEVHNMKKGLSPLRRTKEAQLD
jgi:hypothetical protein